MNFAPAAAVRPAAWTPAPYRPPTAALRGPAALGAAPGVSFIDSPIVAFITDVTVVASTGLLAHLFGKGKSRWNVVFWGIAAVAAFKGLADLSRLHE